MKSPPTTTIVAMNGDMPERSDARNIAVVANGFSTVAVSMANANASSRDAPIAKPNIESKNHVLTIANRSIDIPILFTVPSAEEIVELAISMSKVYRLSHGRGHLYTFRALPYAGSRYVFWQYLKAVRGWRYECGQQDHYGFRLAGVCPAL